jgi:uncharacterized membrane protein YhaH (DUF805 family)
MEIDDNAQICLNCGTPRMQEQTPRSTGGSPYLYDHSQAQRYSQGALNPQAQPQRYYGEKAQPRQNYGEQAQPRQYYGGQQDSSYAQDQVPESVRLAAQQYSRAQDPRYAQDQVPQSVRLAQQNSQALPPQYAGRSAQTPNYYGTYPGPGFLEAVGICFRKYLTFSGRARRSEYWYFRLFCWLVDIVLLILAAAFSGTAMSGIFGLLLLVFGLIILLPGLAVSWRRMHDIGKSGMWNLILFAPCIGWILWLIYLTTDSDHRENEFGRSQKYQG